MQKFLSVSLIVCTLELCIRNEDFILNYNIYYSLKVHNDIIINYAMTLCYKA